MRLGCLPPHPRLLAQCWPHEPVCLGSLESREPADPWLRPPSLPSSRNPQNCRQHRDRDRDLHTAQQLVVAPMRSAHRLYSWSTRRDTQTLKGGEGPRPLKPMAGLGKNLVQVFATLRDLHWECLRLWTGFELSSSLMPPPLLICRRSESKYFRFYEVASNWPRGTESQRHPTAKIISKNSWK
jgi:hypothetical protein